MNEIIAKEVRVQQFNPWPRKEEERGGKGSGREEEQGEAGVESLHLWSMDGGEGLPVAFTASLLTRGAAVHHMGFGLFNKQAPYSLPTRIHQFME